MLAEWGDCRQAYAGPDSVAALAGVTPVTRQSGKHRGVEFRWACNKRFRRAVTTFADNSRHASKFSWTCTSERVKPFLSINAPLKSGSCQEDASPAPL